MSVAERTRAAVRREPFLLDALRAGVVNYSAAARYLDVDGDEESVATALRRLAEDLEPADPPDRRASVRLRRGVGLEPVASDAGEPAADAVHCRVGDHALVDDGSLAAVHATGDLDCAGLEAILGRLRANGVAVEAAAATEEALLVAVGRRAGPEALRIVEDVLE